MVHLVLAPTHNQAPVFFLGLFMIYNKKECIHMVHLVLVPTHNQAPVSIKKVVSATTQLRFVSISWRCQCIG